MSIKVGDPIWHFQANRRVYAKGEHGSPIYREHWVEEKIIGETSRSWLVSPEWRPTKLAKKELEEGKLDIYKLTLKEVEEDCWIHDNQNRIIQHIQYKVKDYETLKAVADLIGYTPEEKK